mgnify:FL=1
MSKMPSMGNFKSDKSIILISSIVLILSVFLWDFKYQIFQSKYLISILLVYNVVLFKKNDLKYYLYFLLFCTSIVIHLTFNDINLIFDKYIIFSIIFLFIYLSVLYKIHLFFDKIIDKSVMIFIFILNIIFILELIQFDFYLYDHPNMVNGLCTLCHKENYLIFDKIFMEKSHFGMMACAVILFSFVQFKNKNKLEKINIIFFAIVSLTFFLSLTLIFGIIISSIALLLFGLLNKFKNKAYILFPIIISLCIFISIPNCWGRLYQVLNLEILYEMEEKNNAAKILGKQLSRFKQITFGKKSTQSETNIKNFLNEEREIKSELEILNSKKNLLMIKKIEKTLINGEIKFDSDDITLFIENKIKPNPKLESKEFIDSIKKFLEINEKLKSQNVAIIPEDLKGVELIKFKQENPNTVARDDVFSLTKDFEISLENKMINGLLANINDYENFNELVSILKADKNFKTLLSANGQKDLEYQKELNKINKELKIIKKKEKEFLKKTNTDKDKYFLDESINATTIVHLNHYMITFKSLKEKTLGYGFQNYKQASLEFAKNNKMIDVYANQIHYNFNDGSNNFNKLLVEFGYLNILFIILFLIFNKKTDISNASKIFIFTIIATQLFRAAGYFNGGFLFVVIAGTFSLFIKQKK